MRRFLSVRSRQPPPPTPPNGIKPSQSDSHADGLQTPVADNDPGASDPPNEKIQDVSAESDSTVQASSQLVPLQPAPLKIKKVDHFYSRWQKKWKYTTTGSNIIPEMRLVPSDVKDEWQQFCFVVVREIPDDPKLSPYFRIVVKSSYLLQACKDVIGEVVGVSWNAVPLTVRHLFKCFILYMLTMELIIA